MVKDALVSLWRSKESAALADFACSGFFVAPGLILTAAHALEAGGPLWARPKVDGVSSFLITPVPSAHPSLDVVLVRIEAMPEGATCLSPILDNSLPRELVLHGYFEGASEAGQLVHPLNFDDAHKQYRLDTKQPEGHSGSALCIGERVWGMAIRHYRDPNIHRGCALAVHQFWDWLGPLLPESAKAEPPPQWDEWVGLARSRMAQAFRPKVFEKFAPTFSRHASGLPCPLAEVLEDADPAAVGENCVEALIALARQCHDAMLDGTPALTAKERTLARKSFLDAMGSAARLCLDPAQLCAQGIDPRGKLRSILDVSAFTVTGATLAARPAPQDSWDCGDKDGIPSLKDKHTEELAYELGEGDDCKRALAAAAYRSVAGPVRTPETIDHALRRSIRGRAVSEARAGRARMLVIFRQLGQEARAELQTWVSENLGVNLLFFNRPQSDTSDLFLFTEEVLLARVYEFLSQLNQPEWNPI